MKTKLLRKAIVTAYCYGLLSLFPLAGLAQSPDLLVCAGTGFTLVSSEDATGLSPVTYTWYENASPITNSDAASISILTGKGAGTYTYVRKAVNAECPEGVMTIPYIVIVVQPAAPVITASASTVCEGADVVFTVPSAANTTYDWLTVKGDAGLATGADNSAYTLSRPKANTHQVQVTATVDYEISGLQATCTSMARASAVVNPLPVVVQTGVTEFCGGGAKYLTVGVNANGSPIAGEEVTITWYSDITGNTSVRTGAAYTTPFLIAPASYYVGAVLNATSCVSNGLTAVHAEVKLHEGGIGGEAIVLIPPPDAASTRTWIYGSQVWSDVIHIPGCNKSDFPESWIEPQCRSYTEGENTWYYYNWPYAAANAARLCPTPWHIPGQSDFAVLAGYTTYSELASFWGYGGYASGDAIKDVGTSGNYWSSTAFESTRAYELGYDSSTLGVNLTRNTYGQQVRCVK